jgi:glycosyltransferase involved in cell wall biosynthesis
VKVLIINDYAAVTGGAERFLENLLHEAEHASIDFHRLDIADLVSARKGVHRSNFINLRYRRIRVIPEIVDLITARIRTVKPDLIHLNNNHLYTNSVVHSLNAAGLSTVWFIHDAYTVRRLQSVLYIKAGQNFTFLTHAQAMYNRLLALGKEAFLVGVPFNFSKWAVPEKSQQQQPSLDLLYVGRIERGKGVFTLVRAFELIRKRMPSITLSLVGDGSQVQALERMVKDKKLTAHIRIRGRQNDDDILRKLYAEARLLIFPSATETLGYVGLEAQACGTPVIAFQNEGTCRWCKDNESGFIVQGHSARKLADKVLEIIHDDVILTRISTAARENIRLQGYNASSRKIPDIYKAIHPE